LDENEYLKMVGAPMLTGEEGYSTLERVWTRPTLDPNGIVGGFTGEGAKTVIPATASCKISMRLVPDQKPAEISQLFRNHIEKICPPTVKCEIIDHHGGLPYLMPLNHPAIRIAARSLERGFGKKPVFVREGGSIPIVVAFKETLNCDTVLLPLGLPDENSHSPNENFYLPNFFSGISSSANFMIEMATGY
jgi:acetylornithine deacetylase/succinyl-diaminopimelate desuccinylase-like protein